VRSASAQHEDAAEHGRVHGGDAERDEQHHDPGPVEPAVIGRDDRHEDAGHTRRADAHRAVGDKGGGVAGAAADHAAALGEFTPAEHGPDSAGQVLAQLAAEVPPDRRAGLRRRAEQVQAAPPQQPEAGHRHGAAGQRRDQPARVGLRDRGADARPLPGDGLDAQRHRENGDNNSGGPQHSSQ